MARCASVSSISALCSAIMGGTNCVERANVSPGAVSGCVAAGASAPGAFGAARDASKLSVSSALQIIPSVSLKMLLKVGGKAVGRGNGARLDADDVAG